MSICGEARIGELHTMSAPRLYITVQRVCWKPIWNEIYLNVIKFRRDTRNISETVIVRVLERRWINLVNDRLFPPSSFDWLVRRFGNVFLCAGDI